MQKEEKWHLNSKNEDSAPRNGLPLRPQPRRGGSCRPTAGGLAATPTRRGGGGLLGSMLQYTGGAGHDLSFLRGDVANGLWEPAV